MTGPSTGKVPDVTAQVADVFPADVAGHTLAVKHDDGLYRHLCCQRPGTQQFWFEIVTWPGSLSINGDMGTYMFSRMPDMFQFFRSASGRISPSYWAQKLVASSGHLEFSPAGVAWQVKANFDDSSEELEPETAEALWQAIEDDILNALDGADETHTREALDSFDHDGFTFGDVGEWDLQQFTFRFLWCCHAIVWAVAAYDGPQAATAP